jgi:uncharacterized membrane protein (UPF0127 family)
MRVLTYFFCFTFLISCNASESPKSEKINSEPSTKKKLESTLSFDTEIEFYSSDGSKLAIQAALAIKPEERNAGLMGIESLPADKGMLFVFEAEQNLSFWMANTPLSLDIIFVDSNFKIVRIHHNTEPFTTKPYESGENAKYVIEVVGGFCVMHDIVEGSEVGFEL